MSDLKERKVKALERIGTQLSVATFLLTMLLMVICFCTLAVCIGLGDIEREIKYIEPIEVEVVKIPLQ